MTAPEQDSASSNPYVGLRPFEREEADLFFGRQRDAERLVDRIVAAPLTLVYAQSGLGKTSLLRALVMPSLEEERYRTFYFDSWSGYDPAGALKTALARQIMPDEAAEAWRERPLIELVREVTQATGQPQVLVLDQFEEFLINHGQQLDPLRQDLAAVIRATGIEVHVAMVMREEFLAALEPFRQVILDLFQSTFRLEGLTADGIRAAIRCPAAARGVEIGPDLMERLISDLQSARQAAASQAAASSMGIEIDLPMLQLVLSQLWANSTRDGKPDLSVAAYERLGAARHILDGYVRAMMPVHRSDRLLTARLLQLLAPPSGYKASYSIDDLAEVTGLNRGAINAELERLNRHRIVRVRDFRGNRRYELLHDAFIPVIAPWRDKELHAARTRKFWLRLGSAAAAVAFFFVAVAAVYEFRRDFDFKGNTVGVLEQALGGDKQQIRTALERATDYHLRHSNDIQALRTLLVAYEAMIEPSQWVNAEGLGFILMTAPKESWPVVLQYGEDRVFDQLYFRLYWHDLAAKMARTWGLPVPTQLRLEASAKLPESLMILTGPTGREVEIKVPVVTTEALINPAEIPTLARSFLKSFEGEWEPINIGTNQYLSVPRWSLPAWRVLGAQVLDREFLTASLVAKEVQNHPQIVLSQVASDGLLDRAESFYPTTVAEAQTVRGERLANDLSALMMAGIPVTATRLPRLLDLLAELPDADSDHAAQLISDALKSPNASFLSAFRGPSAAQAPGNEGEQQANEADADPSRELAVRSAYASAETYLTAVQPPIRLYLGSELVSRFVTNGALDPQRIGEIEDLRDGIYRATGVELPAVRFREPQSEDISLGPTQLRLEVLDQTSADREAEPIDAEAPDKAVGLAMERLAAHGGTYLPRWVTAETAAYQVSVLEPQLRRWIESRYSPTDLKVLLRKIVEPATVGTSSDGSKHNSIRHVDWLLGALVFWDHQIDLRDPAAVAKALNETQKTFHDYRAAGPDAPFLTEAGGELGSWVGAGIAGLRDDAIEMAHTAFRAANDIDPPAAKQAFLAAYARLILERMDRECATLDRTEFERELRVDIEDAKATASADRRRRLEICLLGGLSRVQHRQRWEETVERLAGQKAEVFGWSPDEAARLGELMLQAYNPLTERRNYPEMARPFLDHALARLGAEPATTLFNSLLDICQKPGPHNWCWALTKEFATSHTRDGWLPLQYAWRASSSERRDELSTASQLLDVAERRFQAAPITELVDKLTIEPSIMFARAAIGERLAVLDETGSWDPSIRMFEEIARRGEYLAEEAQDALITTLREAERFAEADAALEEARKQWPEKIGWDVSQFWLAAATNNLKSMRDAESKFRSYLDAHAESQQEDQALYNDILYQAALSEFLLPNGQDPWKRISRSFLQTDHAYVNYVAVLLYASQEGPAHEEARRLLERRWQAFATADWERRLELGDSEVWKEMLIGYYLGKVPREILFGPLTDDEGFAKSLFARLPLSRRGMLCEAYFYDALLSRIAGFPDKMRDALEKTVATNHTLYTEYTMAKFMLANDAESLREPATAMDR